MSNPYVHLYFYSNKQLDKSLVEKIVESCVESGLKYNGTFWVRGTTDDATKPINDAIEEIAKSEGSIHFLWDALDADVINKELYIRFFKNDVNQKIIHIGWTSMCYLFNHDYEQDINEKRRASSNAELLLGLAKNLYQIIQPIYGYFDWDAHISWKYDYLEDPEIPRLFETLDIKNITTNIYWVNFFSPELVQKIGRDKLLSTPSYKTEELKDGGILLMMYSEPFDYEEFDRKHREYVEKHLGINTWNERITRERRIRMGIK